MVRARRIVQENTSKEGRRNTGVREKGNWSGKRENRGRET